MTLDDWIKKKVTWEDVQGGQHVFSGTNVEVSKVACLASKKQATYATIFAKYPFLNTEDVRNAVLFTKKYPC